MNQQFVRLGLAGNLTTHKQEIFVPDYILAGNLTVNGEEMKSRNQKQASCLFSWQESKQRSVLTQAMRKASADSPVEVH